MWLIELIGGLMLFIIGMMVIVRLFKVSIKGTKTMLDRAEEAVTDKLKKKSTDASSEE